VLAAVAITAVLIFVFGWIEIAGSATPRTKAEDVSIICLNKAGSRYKRKVEPLHCAHYGRGGSFGGGVNLKRLEWRSWGGRLARGSGTECGFQLPCSEIDAKVTVYRKRRACGHRVYTRLKSVSGFGRTIVRLKRCPGPA
jgi:hypothetical protein